MVARKRSCRVGRNGMTLVEVMVALAVTALIMTLSLSLFAKQYDSYLKRTGTGEIQQTGLVVGEILKRDLMQAGWSVRAEMAFDIHDGGSSGSDEIYVNDTDLVDPNSTIDPAQSRKERDMLTARDTRDCPGGRAVTSGFGTTTIDIGRTDINGDTRRDFATGQFILSSSTSRVFKVQSVNSASLVLTSTYDPQDPLQSSYVSPAIQYACAIDTEGRGSLQRSDRNTTGNQVFAENVVDLQLAYHRASNDTWYGTAGCTARSDCQLSPFTPQDIDLIRISVVTRNMRRDLSRLYDPNFCRPAVENRSRAVPGDAECGYTYSVDSFYVRPRNFGQDNDTGQP